LTRYPDLKLSTAVMCNSGSRSPAAIERDIFNEIMGPFTPPAPREAVDLKPEELQKYAGFWRDDKTHFPIRTTIVNGKLQFADVPLRPIGDRLFQVGLTKFNFSFDKDGKLVFLDRIGGNESSRYVAEPEWTPTSAELSSLAGRWYSEEADAIFSLVVDNAKAFLTQRPTTKVELRPQYKDGFTVNGQPGTVVWFARDNGKVTMHVGTSRLRDMPFERR